MSLKYYLTTSEWAITVEFSLDMIFSELTSILEVPSIILYVKSSNLLLSKAKVLYEYYNDQGLSFAIRVVEKEYILNIIIISNDDRAFLSLWRLHSFYRE